MARTFDPSWAHATISSWSVKIINEKTDSYTFFVPVCASCLRAFARSLAATGNAVGRAAAFVG